MRAAVQQSVQRWHAKRVYTCVDADNDVAYRLYKGCGFSEATAVGGDAASFDGASTLGRVILLKLQPSA